MNINQNSVLRCLADGIVHPRSPLLGTVLDKTVLDSRNAPRLVKGKKLVKLPFEVSSVYVNEDTDASILRIADDLL